MKKMNLVFLTICLLSGSYIKSNAQISSNDEFYKDCNTPVFYEAELMPQPEEGIEYVLKYLNDKISLTDSDKGVLKVNITMNCKGETRDINLKSAFDEKQNKAIISFFENLNFKPAKQRERNVNCTFQYVVSYENRHFMKINAEVPDNIKKEKI